MQGERKSNGLNRAHGKLKRYSNNRKAANVAQQADVAILLAALAAAEVEDAEATDGEVVADGVGAIEFGEPVGDGSRRFPVRRLAIADSEKRSDAMHVRVERNDELRRIDEIPNAEVGRGAANHPANEEVHALARAAVFGRSEQISQTPVIPTLSVSEGEGPGWVGGARTEIFRAPRPSRSLATLGMTSEQRFHKSCQRRADILIALVVATPEQLAECPVF